MTSDPTTLDVVTAYRARTPAWTFTLTSWVGPKGTSSSWTYRSPRMNANGLIPDGFTEEELRRAESEFYARQQHGASIHIALGQATHSLIEELGRLYRLIDAGKVGAAIPDEVTIKEVKIPLMLPGSPDPTYNGTSLNPNPTLSSTDLPDHD